MTFPFLCTAGYLELIISEWLKWTSQSPDLKANVNPTSEPHAATQLIDLSFKTVFLILHIRKGKYREVERAGGVRNVSH